MDQWRQPWPSPAVVLVVRDFLDVDLKRAYAVTTDLANAWLKQFQHSVAVELEGWMAGIPHWHREVVRCHDADPGKHFGSREIVTRSLLGPTGLGTSSTRILPGKR